MGWLQGTTGYGSDNTEDDLKEDIYILQRVKYIGIYQTYYIRETGEKEKYI